MSGCSDANANCVYKQFRYNNMVQFKDLCVCKHGYELDINGKCSTGRWGSRGEGGGSGPPLENH